MMGNIFNVGDKVYYQDDYGFRGSFFNPPLPTVIDYYTKNKFLNKKLEILRPQRNIENNDKQSDERYQTSMIDDDRIQHSL